MTKSIPRNEARSALIESALAHLADRGPANVHPKDICEELELSKALVNYHFGSRERLIAEAAATGYERYVDELAAAAAAAGDRVVGEVGALLALDPAEQRATPMTIVRTAHREPGAVLVRLGVPHVARDGFEERANPEDVHALAPPDLAAVDPDLGPLLLAWGVGKATVLRARAARDRGAQPSGDETSR